MHSSLAVVAESARRVLVFPSMNVIGSIRGFFDFVACRVREIEIDEQCEV